MDVEAGVEDLEQIDIDKFVQSSLVLSRFSAFRKEGLFCDFDIVVDGEIIPVHRNVICVNSKYFEAMLTHATLESEKGRVEFKEMDKESVKTCIAFMYGEPVRTSGSCERKWARLVLVADMLQLKELLVSIISFLSVKLTIKTLGAICDISIAFSLLDLKQKCVRFAARHFEALTRSDELKCLDVEVLDRLFETHYSVSATECTKLAALIAWTNGDKEARSEAFAVFLRKLILSNVRAAYLRYLIENEPLIKDSLSNLTLVALAIMDSVGVSSAKYTEAQERKGVLALLGGPMKKGRILNKNGGVQIQVQFHS